jgi:hypothetical protein
VPKRNCVLFSDIWILYRVTFSLANVNICCFQKLMASVAILNQKATFHFTLKIQASDISKMSTQTSQPTTVCRWAAVRVHSN